MKVGARMRDEFPKGWWKSGRWWLAGSRDLLVDCAIALATVLFLRRAAKIVRRRDEPRELVTLTRTTEGWLAAGLFNATGVWVLAEMMSAPDGTTFVVPTGPALLAVGWCLLNLAVSAVVLVVLSRSRIRHREAWAELDFIDTHSLKHRPPETVDEYRAQRLKQASETEPPLQ